MIHLKLIHKDLGLVAEYACKYNGDIFKKKQRWKQMYGRQFRNCIIQQEGSVINSLINNKKVMVIETEEVFESIALASKATGDSKTTISNHCHRRIDGSLMKYRYRWAE